MSNSMACALLLLLAMPAQALKQPQEIRPKVQMIDKTDVPKPADYEDWTRGRKPWTLFPTDQVPGARVPLPAKPGSVVSSMVGTAVPEYEPKITPEHFDDASHDDIIGARCAPGGDAAGHYFYNVEEPAVVPYIVDKSDPNFKDMAVVVCPGGGSIHLAWEPEGISAAEWLNSHGISAFVLKYRVPDSVGDLQVMDGQRAVSLIRHNAPEHGFNPNRIGIMGFSAGGGIALTTSSREERAYQPIDAVDEVSCKPDFTFSLYGPPPPLSPEQVAALPILFQAYTVDDPCIPVASSRDFHEKLDKYAIAPHMSKEYPDGKHGWASCDYYPQKRGMEVCGWKDLAMNWLKEQGLVE